MTSSIDRLNKLLAQAESGKKGQYSDKDGFWKVTTDKDGNGSAVIRFLPEPTGEDFCWAHYWSHAFQGPTGKWYINKSRTTLGKGERDPVGEMNRRLYSTGLESDKDIVSKGKNQTKRKEHYVFNILVIKDDANPAAEGQVFKFRTGSKIFEKIMHAMKPPLPHKAAFEPFSYNSGANFHIYQRQKDGFPNYDLSEWDQCSPLFGGDKAKQDVVQSKLHSLKEYTDPAQYKSYDELAKELHEVMGDFVGSGVAVVEGVTSRAPVAPRATHTATVAMVATPEPQRATIGMQEAPATSLRTAPSRPIVQDDGDDDMELFKKLANGNA